MPGVGWVYPHSVKDLLLGWSYFPIRENARKLWMATPLSFLWTIWKERNKLVFEDASFSFNRLKVSFFTSLFSWARFNADLDYTIVSFFVLSLGL